MEEPPWGASSPRERVSDSGMNVSLKFSKRARAPGEKGDPSDSKSVRSLGGDSDPSKRPKLGKTEGMVAMGAWAARLEIAQLLSSGVSPSEVIRMIQSGQEGSEPLKMSTPSGALSDLGEDSPSFDEEFKAFPESKPGEMLEEEQSPSKVAQEVLKLSFKKRATGPPGRSDYTPSIAPTSPGEGAGEGVSGDQVVKMEDLMPVLESFKKKAVPPKVQPVEINTPKTPVLQKTHPKRRHQKEEELYENFFTKCQMVFEDLVVADVEMDLIKLVATDDGAIKVQEFKSLTEPRNAATGVRYANLMLNYCEFFRKKYGMRCVEPHILSSEYLLEYIQRLIDAGAGFRTPQGLLYALEYFKVAFGYEGKGTKNLRCKKLADNYSLTAPPRNPAPHLDIDLLEYLERSVLDEKKPTAYRLVAGLLRLCAQSSTRHNDVQNTPLVNTEWVRIKGSDAAVGLRALAPKTKTGPRPWTCCYLGVKDTHDGWLPTFMSLLLKSHGSGWKEHAFFHCATTHLECFTPEPSTIGADVILLKQMMDADRKAGLMVPVSNEEILAFRWHSCKSTMPTFMSHFGVKGKAIRHQGAWSKTSDAMPDAYLRQAQTLVIKAQMATLGKIRRGLNIETLVGSKLENFPTKFSDARDEEEELEKASYASQLSPHSLSAVAMDAPAASEPLSVEPEDFRIHWLPQVGEWPAELAEDATKDEAIFREYVASEKKIRVEVPNDLLADLEDAIIEDETTDDESPVDEDDLHYEGFVVVSTGKGKMHLPKPGEDQLPMCGARSENFMSIDAGEVLPGDVDLCRRCFGQQEACRGICSHTKTVGGRVLRCGRRCSLHCGEVKLDADDRVHACLFHTEATMLNDV